MVRIRIDVPVFSSPTEAFGRASGELEVVQVPESGSVFPWPLAWREAKPRLFSDQDQSRIWHVDSWNLTSASDVVGVYGFVFGSVSEARDCGAFFASIAGFDFVEHG